VLHVQMPYSPILAGRVIRMAPKSTRIVGTFHILPYNLMAVLGTRLLKVLLGSRRRIDVSFAVSPPALDFMKKDFGLDGAVLANPVDYDFFNRHNKQTDTVAGRIVFVGRFEERKGVEQLVSAYEVLSKTTACELILCGKGPMLERLKEVNKAKNLGITMTGFVSEEDKAKYLASAELAVFPSTGGESFGIVLAEAMAAGSGVTLGGNNPGYASVLGVWPETLFDPNDIEGFAEKLKEFIENRDLRIKIGNSQRNAVSEYDVKKICSRLMNEAYKLTLDKKS
ncbi:glycosyltransferase family 4 protein, partial [Candidatus Saccharibacteria bacterium]|nr:glycosyltransferase family 4 protein [Candidatus Saccharibacteria bacterium]